MSNYPDGCSQADHDRYWGDKLSDEPRICSGCGATTSGECCTIEECHCGGECADLVEGDCCLCSPEEHIGICKCCEAREPKDCANCGTSGCQSSEADCCVCRSAQLCEVCVKRGWSDEPKEDEE